MSVFITTGEQIFHAATLCSSFGLPVFPVKQCSNVSFPQKLCYLLGNVSPLLIFLYIFMHDMNYRPQRSCGQGDIFRPVCHSVHRGGLLPGGSPVGRTPPPAGRTPPPAGRTPLPGSRHPPPRDADCSIRSTNGRHASYWNAFLFLVIYLSGLCC